MSCRYDVHGLSKVPTLKAIHGFGVCLSVPDGNYVWSGFGTLGMNPGTPLLTTELNLTFAVM